MEEKIKLLEQVALEFGLSLQDVVDSWVCQGLVEVPSCKNIIDINKKQPKEGVVNLDFPKNDIRLQTKLFWYAFEGGKFSPNPKTYPNCQGVVGWINPDPNAPEGERIYVVLPEQKYLQYSERYYLTGADDLYDGRANTKKLIEYGKKYRVRFPAVECAHNYTKNGVKKGETFLPAREQLKLVVENCEGVRKALKLIGGTFEGWLWSSSEYNSNYAWNVYSSDGDMYGNDKEHTNSVSCFLAY